MSAVSGILNKQSCESKVSGAMDLVRLTNDMPKQIDSLWDLSSVIKSWYVASLGAAALMTYRLLWV